MKNKNTYLQEECEYFIKNKVLTPVCGYELIINDMIVADVELAWPAFKVCIFNDDADPQSVQKFGVLGWHCYQVPLSDIEFEEIISTTSKNR
ncbi:hypothetical protein [Vibrio albus]|uniref:hypothetical protein n=1 Tax=Vibrio albus TaxID=2200953 RepID=UPI0011B29E51|nr:hypothetical protein [Vibrio albus]